MNTDRELLEKAAKAAGMTLGWIGDVAFDVTKLKARQPVYKGVMWNPLTDDGDALRLLIKLPFRELYVSKIGATVSWKKDGGPHRWKCDEYASENGDSLSAATRLAIVRAAAALAGEAKP